MDSNGLQPDLKTPRVTAEAVEVEFKRTEYEAPTTEQQEIAASYLDEVRNVNLDEVVVGEVPVAINKYVEVTSTDENGDELVTTQIRTRVAHIRTKVPMRLFNKMLEAHDGVMRGADSEKKIDWMTDQVLAVWQITEPKITKDEILDGLDFEQIGGLFTRFFDKQLRLLRNNRRRGSDSR